MLTLSFSRLAKYLSAAVLASTVVQFASFAAPIRFTATSTGSGELGYFDIEDSILNHTPFQFVQNSSVLNLFFQNPFSGDTWTFADIALSPSGQGTLIDSTGIPTVVGGAGDFASSAIGSMFFANSDHVMMFGTAIRVFGDVSWSSAPVPTGRVPDSTTTVTLLGIALVGLVLSRRAFPRRQTT